MRHPDSICRTYRIGDCCIGSILTYPFWPISPSTVSIWGWVSPPPLETRDRRDRMIAAVETFFKSIKAELIWRHP